MNTHQVLIVPVVNTKLLSRVADSMQERRFASISPTKDTKASTFRLEVIEFTVSHGCCRYVNAAVDPV